MSGIPLTLTADECRQVDISVESTAVSSNDLIRKTDRCHFGWRHAITLLTFTIVVVCYADRTNIGIVLAQAPFPGIPHEEKGGILSAFFAGYFFTQVLGGYLARRYGSKPTILAAALAWTLFDILTPPAAAWGLPFLLVSRAGMGLGEGLVFPAIHGLCGYWIPEAERASLMTFISSGQDAGSILANVVSPRLLELGVMWVFGFWGTCALLWFVSYALLAASAPEVHSRCVRSGEAAWIQDNRNAVDFNSRRWAESPIPRRLLREPCVWAIFAGHVGQNYAWYVLLSWMPSFFKGRFGLNLADVPFLLAGPYAASWAGSVLGGQLSDRLVGRGIRVRSVRKGMQITGALTNALFLQLAASATTPGMAALWISLGAAFGKLQNSGFIVNVVDVCPESASTLMGMSNTLATIPGIVGQPITQFVLDSLGGEASQVAWHVTFGIGGAVAVLCGLVFVAFADDVSLDTLDPPAGEGGRGAVPEPPEHRTEDVAEVVAQEATRLRMIR